MSGDGPGRDVVLAALERVLASAPFRQSERSAGLLRFLVERSLTGGGERLKELTVGIEGLGRGADFDPRTDPIVRAEASRLRGRLERYYAAEGAGDPLVIELPKGAYAVRFHERSATASMPSDETAAPRHRRANVTPLLWGIVGVAAVIAAFAVGSSVRAGPPPSSPTGVVIDVALQSDERIASDVGTSVVIAPDGRSAVYVSIDSTATTHLRLNRFDGTPPVDLPGTAGGRGPFWSPDGRWIGFWASGQLRKVAVDGGSPVVLCDAPDLLGASWGRDGTIVAAIDASNRLVRVDAANGGTPRPVIDASPDRAAALWPQLLPDGEHVLFTALGAGGVDRATIEVASLRDGARKVLIRGGTFARFVAPGHLTYVNQGTLYAIAFDVASLSPSGPAVPIVDDVAYSATFGYAQVSVSETGTLVYRQATASGRTIVARVERSGASTALLERPGRYAWPALSPDGRRLALASVESGVSGLTVFDLGRPTRQAWTVAGHDAPLWTSDGTALVARRGNSGLSWLSGNTGRLHPFLDVPKIVVPWTFARGDRAITMAIMDTETVFDLWSAPVERLGDSSRAGRPVALLRSKAFETYPAISPDERWLAYSSNASGFVELHVRSLADTGRSVPVARGGRAPRWSPFGRELLFSSADHRLMVVSYSERDGRFVASAPREWAPIDLADTGVLPNFNLGPDGASVIALLPERPATPNQVRLVQGFPALLQRGSTSERVSGR